MRARKRSAAITLVLAGSAGLGGCGSPVEQRDAYASQAACVRDWGNAAKCQPVRDNRYASSYYYGPTYYGNRYSDGRPKPSRRAMISRSVSRVPPPWSQPGPLRTVYSKSATSWTELSGTRAS